ncbi:hypothetical protein R6Q59_032288 [Mikania micrantha]|uniref:DUF4378 domain-containing protein n=1 Tax=Mikania micrantha TaxID=192012 RepID=A0A5N6NT47_9ASTR|nr:hypothetical protein E3N88_16964 [Mikania micrantha]
MAKRSQQRPARQKKDTSGCMSGIISMFNFRHGRISRRLLSDHRRYMDNNTHGPPSPTSEVNLPINVKAMQPRIEDSEIIRKPSFDNMRKRVKEVTEEKMFINHDPKFTRKNHEHVNISKTLKKSFDEEISMSHQAQQTSQHHDLEALVREILRIYRNRNEQHGDLCTGAKQSFPIVKEKLIAAIEALLKEKSRNGDYKKFHHSKEMFQVLSSNKEMFLKMLQDQNLILLNEDQKSKSNSKGQELEEPLIRKRRKIFRRSRSQESIPLYENDRIVILKPGCSENQVSMGNGTDSNENGSQSSSLKVKRRLKHTMGNEQKTSGPSERAGKMVDGGWSSPNRDHFYTERFAKITNGLKTRDRLSKSHETRSKHENAENQISNIYVEAKKHLSEMLTSGDEDAESMKRSLPAHLKNLGRILSLQEYNSLSPDTTPRGQPRSMANKSQLMMTIENPEGEIVVLDNVACEGDQEIVNSPSSDKEHEKQKEGCQPRDSLYEDQSLESLALDLQEKNEFSSSQNRNEHSLASKTDEHETSPGKPSPVSVLEPLFSDDEITPARTISLPVGSTVRPRCIEFDESICCAENQQIRITDSEDNVESVFEYVEAVLLSSDLNWSEFETRWFSSVQILDPSLFDEVVTFSGRAKHDQKFLFDSTNEVLEDVCNRFIAEPSFIKRNVWPVPRGKDLINEVWSRLELRLGKLYPREYNELVRNDLETCRFWLDLQTGSFRDVVVELEDSIFEEIIDNIIFDLFTY